MSDLDDSGAVSRDGTAEATPAETTENHGYQLFADGQPVWEHRTDFRALDTDVEIRDVSTSRSGYTPKIGALFRAIDTGRVYYGLGTTWVELNPGPWTTDDDGGISLPTQDLSEITPTDGSIYRHDGSSSITANGAETDAEGYYSWSETDDEFKTLVAH